MSLSIAWACFGILSIGAGTITALFADRLAHTLRPTVLVDCFEAALQSTPLFSSDTAHSSSHLSAVVTDGAWCLWELWLESLRRDVEAVLTLLVLLPVSLYVNPTLSLLLLVLCAVFAAITAWALFVASDSSYRLSARYTEESERLGDTLANLPLIQSYGMAARETASFRAAGAALLGDQLPMLKYWAVVVTITQSATTLTIMCIVLAGAALQAAGRITVGEIVTFIAFARMVIARLDTAVEFCRRLGADMPKLAAFFELLDAPPAVQDAPSCADLVDVKGDIEFDRVSYTYPGSAGPAVHDLSFRVAAGQTVALVGCSGAGKSTVINLLCRCFDPSHGAVRVDGVDVRTVAVASLRRCVSVVFQESMMLNRSIADNLRAGRADATTAELLAAATRAQAHGVVTRGAGLDTAVGEHGRGVSGGERQRLAIARAMLKEAPILVLDEATSALDSHTELLLQQALDAAAAGRTTLVIAHRLSTVRRAHRIVVLQDGRVVESGTYAELLAAKGAFAALHDTQFSL